MKQASDEQTIGEILDAVKKHQTDPISAIIKEHGKSVLNVGDANKLVELGATNIEVLKPTGKKFPPFFDVVVYNGPAEQIGWFMRAIVPKARKWVIINNAPEDLKEVTKVFSSLIGSWHLNDRGVQVPTRMIFIRLL